MGRLAQIFGFEPPAQVEPDWRYAADQERETTMWGDIGWSGSASPGLAGGAFAERSGLGSFKLSVVYACVNLVAGKIAQMPVKYWRVDPVTGKQVKQLALPSWVRNPDPQHGVLGMSWQDVVFQIVTSMLLAGNAYVAFSCSQPGRVRELAVLDPSSVDVEVTRDNEFVLRVCGRPPDDYQVLPIRYVVPPGRVLGISAIRACHRALTVAEGAQEQSAGFFTRGATVPGQIVFQNEVTNDQLKRIASDWNRQHAGVGKSHLPLFLQGAEFKQIGLSPEDAQTLETWQWSDARIAKHIFGVDPSWVAAPLHGTNITYTNSRLMNLTLYEYALLPLIRRIEHCFDWLCPANGQYALRFDNSAFLADEPKVRWATYAQAVKAGLMTVNEARAKEDLEPLPEPEPEPAPPAGENSEGEPMRKDTNDRA